MGVDDALVAARVREWVGRALVVLESAEFAQIDLDDLLGDVSGDAIRVGLRCLDVARAESGLAVCTDTDRLLVIPLPWSETLSLSSPDFDDLLATSWQTGPGKRVPGLYLVRSVLWGRYEEVEEYRRHLPTEATLGSGYAAYYRCWRSVEEAEAGWEYNRAVYVRSVTLL